MALQTPVMTHLPPQVGRPASAASMMAEVMIALLPSLGMAVFFFGSRVLALCAVSIVSCVGFEALYRFLTRQEQVWWDLSACVTGLLLAMSLPASAPYWAPVLGGAFAVIVVKQFYGGLGKNFMNPALGGRMLLATFPVLMTTWSQPLDRLPLLGVDAVSAPTPMSYLHEGALPPLELNQLLLGQHGGCLGEVSALMVLFGGCYLILRRITTPRIPAAYLGCVFLTAFLFPGEGAARLDWALAELLSGGVLLGAFFFAVDPVTSPVTARGQVLYGISCGLLTMLLRYHSSYPEGVGWAILVMNCGVWLLDRAGLPRRFGVGRFATLREWFSRTREDLSQIKFVMPSFRPPARDGRAPGEALLDRLRACARPAACLAAVILATGAAVFGVHYLTDLDTARAETREQQELIGQVMPQAAVLSETPYQANGALSILAGYSADYQLTGYCVEVQSQGFGGVLTMMVGVDLNGEVTGVAVTDHKETPGVGTKAMTPAALSRYAGRSGTIRHSGANSVDAVSGSTATSRAITAGVNRALAVIANLDTSVEAGSMEIPERGGEEG